MVVQNTGYLWTFILVFWAACLPCPFVSSPWFPSRWGFLPKTPKERLVNGLIYGASIIVIYVLLGLLIYCRVWSRSSTDFLPTGFRQHAFFHHIYCICTFLFGFYKLPAQFMEHQRVTRWRIRRTAGHIFMAHLHWPWFHFHVPPIIGSALVTAASKGEYMGPFLVMFGFSLALALPFGLFAAFPAWLNTLPKSGSWMNSVKVVLGFLELALPWSFYQADMTNHWGVLKYELFMALWILAFLGMAAYLFGFIKFPRISPIKKTQPYT